MNIKTFLRAPEQGIAELGLTQTSESARYLLRQVDTIADQRQRLKLQKRDKARVASQFKALDRGTDEHAALVRRMQEVTGAYKALENSVKRAERALREQIDELVERTESGAPPFYSIPLEGKHHGDYSIRELDKSEKSRWFQFVAQQENAPSYCTAPWSEAMRNAFGRPTRIWAAFSSQGELLGGVALTVFDSRLFGRFAVSVPYVNYGGILTPYFNIAQALLRHLEGVRESEAFSHIEIRTMQPGLGLPASDKKVSMVLPLPKTEAELDRRLGSKLRAQCKKAEAFNPDIRFGALELLDDFYRVFATNMRDLGTPVYGKKWFKEILSHHAIESTLVVTYVKGQAVSAGFLAGHNGMLEIPWASTRKSANAMDSNMWMYRQILDYAVREGYEFVDFGRSTRDTGTYRFKKQWGAQPYEHYWYYVLPVAGVLPALNPDNPKYRLLIFVWKRLPLWLTALIGPAIVKNIP